MAARASATAVEVRKLFRECACMRPTVLDVRAEFKRNAPGVTGPAAAARLGA
jgi:hypothetical protein